MKRLLTLLGLVLLVSAVQADSIATIELQNRPAEEVIPIVQPMLGEGDAISGQGFKVFLRSSPATLARVRDMIEVLDTPARILEISVFQGSSRDIRELEVNASAEINRGDASVEGGSDGSGQDDAGGRLIYSTNSGAVSADGLSTRQSLRDNPIHQVRVTEGTEAYIETGERIPYFYGGAWRGRRGTAGTIEYENAVTGFYVLPRVRGENVVLEISPYKHSQSNTRSESIEMQSARTTITGRAGEWLMVGGVTEQQERADSAIGTVSSTQSGDNSGIWVRADLVQ